MKPFATPLSLVLLTSSLLLTTAESARGQAFGGEGLAPPATYSVTVASSVTLGEPLELTIGYHNTSFEAATVEHPRTLAFAFVLTRIDITEDAPSWSNYHDGRLIVDERNGILAWETLPADMVDVAARSSVQESFDLQELLDLAAIDPGRYRLTVSWGEGANAESADAVFDLVVEPSGASEKYLRRLAVDGNPAEQRWAKQKLASGGGRR